MSEENEKESLAYITPAMLVWAREKSKFTVREVAYVSQIDEAKIIQWEEGAKHPTFDEAIRLAEALEVPLVTLWLSKPPELSGKEEYIKVELMFGDQSQGSYMEPIESVPNIIGDELGHLNEGDSYRLTKVLMTQEEFDAMPEFTGF